MARRHKKRKITAWNRKFGAVAKACFPISRTPREYGSCMRSELKGRKHRKRSRK